MKSFSLRLLLPVVMAAIVTMAVLFAYKSNFATLIDPDLPRFEKFISEYGRSYITKEERENRFDIFKANMRYVDDINSRGLSYQLGVNQFADKTDEEFLDQYAMSRPE